MQDKNYIEALQKKKKELLNKISLLDEMINEYQTKESTITELSSEPTNNSDYDAKGSWREKIAYVIKKRNRFIHIRELADSINELENNKHDLTVLKQKLSSNLNRMKHDGVLTNYQVDNSYRNIFWGSVRWIDGDGKIKDGYEYDPKYIYKNVKKLDLI